MGEVEGKGSGCWGGDAPCVYTDSARYQTSIAPRVTVGEPSVLRTGCPAVRLTGTKPKALDLNVTVP